MLDSQRPVMPELSTESVIYCAVQLQKEAREKEETLQRMLSAEKRVRILEEENRQLRREATEARKELDRLRKEVSQYLSISTCVLIKLVHWLTHFPVLECPPSSSWGGMCNSIVERMAARAFSAVVSIVQPVFDCSNILLTVV